jgi:hypothetical protein
MAEKKRMYEAEMMAMPPQRFMLGDMPVLNLDGRHNAGLKPLKLDPEMENTVKRLIAHLKDEK